MFLEYSMWLSYLQCDPTGYLEVSPTNLNETKAAILFKLSKEFPQKQRIDFQDTFILQCYSLTWKMSWKKTRYLIFGTVKSEGSLDIFTIWGLLGNFSKIRRRNGSFSFVSAFASLCFNYKRNKNLNKPGGKFLFF